MCVEIGFIKENSPNHLANHIAGNGKDKTVYGPE